MGCRFCSQNPRELNLRSKIEHRREIWVLIDSCESVTEHPISYCPLKGWDASSVLRGGDISQEFVSSRTKEKPKGTAGGSNQIQGLSPPALEMLWVWQWPESWTSGFRVLTGRTDTARHCPMWCDHHREMKRKAAVVSSALHQPFFAPSPGDCRGAVLTSQPSLPDCLH